MFISPQESFDAVKELISTSLFEQTLRVLKTRQDALIAPTAVAFLQELVARAYKGDNTEDARFLQTYVQLLQDAQKDGVMAAWQHFKANSNPVTEHLQAGETRLNFLLRTDEPEDTLLYLRAKQHLLLAKDTIAWMREYRNLLAKGGDQDTPKGNPFVSIQEMADFLAKKRFPESRKVERLLSLLEEASVRDIDSAWTHYCERLQQEERERAAEFAAEFTKEEDQFWRAFALKLDIPSRLLLDYKGFISQDPQVLLRHAQKLMRPFYLPYKIYLLSLALERVKRDENPHLWADIHYERGTAYEINSSGDIIQNKEFAIADYEAALLVEDRPSHRKALLGQRATAYGSRAIGNKQDFLATAIGSINEALSLVSREDDPNSWVRLITNRGAIYDDRQAANPEESIEMAIADYNAALKVLTPHPYAFVWASTMLNRGNAYIRYPKGGPRQNWEKALADYDAALTVYTPDRVGWAMTHRSRGAVLTFFKERDKLEAALAEFDLALSFYTRDIYPADHVTLLLARGHTFIKQGRWREAHTDYSIACEIEREVLDSATSEASRTETIALRAKTDMYLRNVEALLHLDDPDLPARMAVILEEGRAQSMRVALDLDALDLERTYFSPEAQASAEAVIAAREGWRIAQQELAVRPPTSIKQETFLEMYPQRLRDAHAAFERARDAYRQFVPTFMAPPSTIDDIARAIGAPDEALVYLAAGSECGIAVAVSLTESGKPRTEHLVLPHFTENNIDTLLWTVDNPSLESAFTDDGGTIFFPHDDHLHNDHLVGGYMLAQAKSGLAYLGRWGESVSDAIGHLPPESSLAFAAQRLARDWADSPVAQPLLDTPFVNLTKSDLEILDSAFGQALLSIELTRSLRSLGEWGLSEVAKWLRDQTMQKVTIVPYGRLGLFPLPAAIIETKGDQEHVEQTLDSLFEVAIVPSAHSLAIARQRAVETDTNHQQILAVGNASLEYAGAEVENTECIAARFSVGPVHCLTGSNVTRKNVEEGLKRAWLVHLAMHGQYNQEAPRQSRLILAGEGSISQEDQTITLEECLSRKISLIGIRLLILSACKTSIIDVRRAPNEVIGIAAGFLQAGTASVIASLWAVDDLATCLLMSRFMQLYLDPEHKDWSSARCLAKAQHWLRIEATNEVLATYDLVQGSRKSASLTLNLSPTQIEALEFVQEVSAERAKVAPYVLPYADPFYWAAFTVVGC